MDRTAARHLLTITTVIAAVASTLAGLLFAHLGASTDTALIAAAGAWTITAAAISKATDTPLIFRSVCLLLGAAVALPPVLLLKGAGLRIRIA